MWKVLLKAARFARAAHGEQKRGQGTPYYKHPMAVARLLWNRGHRELPLLKAAYLHDVVEDCEVTFETLFEEFGPLATELVAAVTKQPGEPKEAYFMRVKAAGPLAVALKTADREHNNSELHSLPPEKAYMREKAAMKTAAMNRVFFGT